MLTTLLLLGVGFVLFGVGKERREQTRGRVGTKRFVAGITLMSFGVLLILVGTIS